MRAIGHRPVILSLVTLLGGCKSIETGAREKFSKDYTCPIDRVEVRPRPDVKSSDYDGPSSPPSKEIANDPERLKMWEAEQQKDNGWRDRREKFFEARGCGKQTLYECHRMTNDYTSTMCSKKPYLKGVAQW